jgi:hypothetical protein
MPLELLRGDFFPATFFVPLFRDERDEADFLEVVFFEVVFFEPDFLETFFPADLFAFFVATSYSFLVEVHMKQRSPKSMKKRCLLWTMHWRCRQGPFRTGSSFTPVQFTNQTKSPWNQELWTRGLEISLAGEWTKR